MNKLFFKIINHKGKLSLLKPNRSKILREISATFNLVLEDALAFFHIIREIHKGPGFVNLRDFSKKKKLSEDDYFIFLGRIVNLKGKRLLEFVKDSKDSLYPVVKLSEIALKGFFSTNQKPFMNLLEITSYIADVLKMYGIPDGVMSLEDFWKRIDRRIERPILRKVINKYFTPYTVEERFFVLFLLAKEKIPSLDIFDYASFFDIFFRDTPKSTNFWNELISGNLGIVKDSIVFVEKTESKLFEGDISVNEKLLELLDNPGAMLMAVRRKRVGGLLYLADTSKDEKLFFSSTLKNNLELLERAITKDNYERIRKELNRKGFPSGIVALFYGAPGTGKTASVYYLGKKTGRKVYQVDLATIKNKWLGESEKNVKRIFREYRDLSKREEHTPILLLNEADGIISKRVSIKHSVDQTMNTMQNILLEELEDFEGICIATTNLDINMDDAFSRRFLFKIEFTSPDYEARKNIWETKLPGLSEEEYEILAEKELTGAEISNVCKKVELREIIMGENISIEEILSFISEEKNYKAETQVGFYKN